MISFSYDWISRDFISHLSEKAASGESIVLLGPRYGGKRYVMGHLPRLWSAQYAAPTVTLQLLADSPVCTAAQLEDVVKHAVAAVAPDIGQPSHQLRDPLTLVRLLAERVGKPVHLIAANVDAMTHHLARSFLQGVRNLVEEKGAVVVLSGEDNLNELVYGPNSEFNCANQHVLQGYSEQEFDDRLRPYLVNMNLAFEEHTEASRHLWLLSGGNVYILRIILWSIIQSRTRNQVPVGTPVRVDEIADPPKVVWANSSHGSHIFRRAAQVIERAPDCWGELESLIAGDIVRLPLGQVAPGRLELAGVAVRECGDDGRPHLRVSSPIMQAFIAQYYDERRFGDLYASIGEWGEASERYGRLAPEARKRPAGADDRMEVEATIGALATSLHSAAHTRDDLSDTVADRVKRLFVGGCNYVLGFSEVTFLHRTTWQKDTNWRLDHFDDYRPGKDVLRRIMRVLPSGVALPYGPHALPYPESKFAAAVVLPTQRVDEQAAVVVSDFGQEVVISHERERLIRRLIEHFVTAYAHAVKVDELNIRLRVRDRHVQTINSILRSLGEHDLSVDKVLTLAAEGLLRLHHRRVIFSLVDPERRYIEVVLDKSYNSHSDLAGRYKWELRSPMSDIHAYVVKTGDALITKDVSQEPVADKEFVRAARLKALALIPLLNHSKEAVGAVLVERDDGKPPSEQEVEDLKVFCNQLTIAIEQCERLNMLEAGINRIPEPLIVVDGTASPRYANKPAADLLGIGVGWRDRNDVEPLTPERDGRIAELVRESLGRGYRLASHVEMVGKDPGYHGEAVADAIRDWRGKIVGGLIRIQDRNYLHKYFMASNTVAESNDTQSAVRNMLEAARALGHRWGRLYRIEKDDEGERFVSQLSFGYSDGEAKGRFDRGEVVLARHAQGGDNEWLCVEKGSPIVFCWLNGVGDGVEYVTPHGLRAINWTWPQQPAQVGKKPGDFWIDFPLMTSDGVMGKMCLQCDRDLRPENFELLKKLSETYADLFGALLSRERDVSRREELIRMSVAEKTVASMVHSLATRLTAIPVVLTRYRRQERKYADLKPLNDEFADVTAEVLDTVTRAKELLKPVVPRLSAVDLPAQIERTLRSSLPEEAWELQCGERPLTVQIDVNLFGTAILELAQNSLNAAPEVERMHIWLAVEIVDPSIAGGGQLRITYRDNGPGIPVNIREHIFEDFFSYRPERPAGTGLGMGFVRRVVEAHGGTVSVGPGEPGAEFIIALPTSPPAAVEGA